MVNEAAVIHELREWAKLVETIYRRRRRVVVISAEAIIRWRKDDPRSWKLVLEWLTRMDVEINVN